MNAVALTSDRIQFAKRAYTTRHVPMLAMRTLAVQRAPRSGDVVLARVEELGHHEGLELPGGRRAKLYPGDEILVCYGNRYAPDQFEAQVPVDLKPCHLVAQGGIAAHVVSWHTSMRTPTLISPFGIVGTVDGRPINLRHYGLPKPQQAAGRPRAIASIGTSMNAGKTTTAANLIRGLAAAGLRVGAAKVTGTGAGKDLYLMRDAGAFMTLDFTDAGFPTTYMAAPREIEEIVTALTGHLAAAGADVIVLEVADGLYQRETATLCRSPFFAEAIDELVFSAGDAMGAAAGVAWLRACGLEVRAVSGALTASPLAVREAAGATGLPVLTGEALRDAAVAELVGLPALAA